MDSVHFSNFMVLTHAASSLQEWPLADWLSFGLPTVEFQDRSSDLTLLSPLLPHPLTDLRFAKNKIKKIKNKLFTHVSNFSMTSNTMLYGFIIYASTVYQIRNLTLEMYSFNGLVHNSIISSNILLDYCKAIKICW